MRSLSNTVLRTTDIDRFFETGITVIRRKLKRNSVSRRNLQYLPVNLFGAVMGLAGLSIAWRQAGSLFGISQFISNIIAVVAVTAFLLLAFFYVWKSMLFPGKVTEEFKNPIVGNFYGTITISLLLLSSVVYPFAEVAALVLWSSGVILTLGLSYTIVNRLLKNKQEIQHATPAWLIPGVGTLDIAVTSGNIPFEWAKEINLLSFAIGSILALVFFTIIFSRLMHHDALPERLRPSLIILIAPFEVGFLAYINITGRVDIFAAVLFYFGLFLFTIMFFKVFRRNFPFMVSWWAVAFPIAALTNASLKYAMHSASPFLLIVAAVILAILTILIVFILFRTLVLIARNELLQV